MNIENLILSKSCQVPFLAHFYEKYLSDHGFFVEVGGFDGESYSNTSCLADLGWFGIYIEPHPVYAQACKLRHPQDNIRVINVAISDSDQPISLSVGGAATTASSQTLEAYGQIEWAKSIKFSESIIVPALTLDKLLSSARVHRYFDLLVVDVEGFEEQVFNSFNLAYWSPSMMIVELNDYHSSFREMHTLQNSSRNVRNRILSYGYFQAYADSVNTIFISDRLM